MSRVHCWAVQKTSKWRRDSWLKGMVGHASTCNVKKMLSCTCKNVCWNIGGYWNKVKKTWVSKVKVFLISNFRLVLNLVCILDVKYEVYFILHIQPLKMEQIECSETSANHNQTPEKYPKEYRQKSESNVSLNNISSVGKATTVVTRY